jgi:hypothetical protein
LGTKKSNDLKFGTDLVLHIHILPKKIPKVIVCHPAWRYLSRKKVCILNKKPYKPKEKITKKTYKAKEKIPKKTIYANKKTYMPTTKLFIYDFMKPRHANNIYPRSFLEKLPMLSICAIH